MLRGRNLDFTYLKRSPSVQKESSKILLDHTHVTHKILITYMFLHLLAMASSAFFSPPVAPRVLLILGGREGPAGPKGGFHHRAAAAGVLEQVSQPSITLHFVAFGVLLLRVIISANAKLRSKQAMAD